jgi:zinc/manganese transport system ATP-binding protein
MNVVELDGVTIRVGGRSVLSNVSFTVGDAEFIGVLGPNGAGKTTLMRTLLGLIRPTSGTVRVLGKSPMRGNPEIGYLPQVRTVTPNWACAASISSPVR